MLNPDIKVAKSKGIDLPVMYVYLAGRIAGNCIDKCLGWRQDIVNHYKNYRETEASKSFIKSVEYPERYTRTYESYPIAFIDPLNSGEANSVDKQGLTSSIPPNLIFDKDLLSVERADVIVANVEDYFEIGIEDLMEVKSEKYMTERDYMNNVIPDSVNGKVVNYEEAFYSLQEKIKNRRENFGTICEIAWALYLKKPLILIVPEARKDIYMKHPFAKRASVIVTSVDQLLKEKWLNTLYKSISGATY